jgi:hypothetical protein
MNIWSILVASVVAFAIGALWYSPMLFGKEWMALSKMTDADMASARSRGIWKLYIAQFVITIVMYAVLGFIVASNASVTATDGAFSGFLVWLGFYATAAISGMMWEKKSFKLQLISSIGMLVNLVVGGAIIGAWH